MRLLEYLNDYWPRTSAYLLGSVLGMFLGWALSELAR